MQEPSWFLSFDAVVLGWRCRLGGFGLMIVLTFILGGAQRRGFFLVLWKKQGRENVHTLCGTLCLQLQLHFSNIKQLANGFKGIVILRYVYLPGSLSLVAGDVSYRNDSSQES